MNEYQRQILIEAASHREKEVLHHQINITNYKMALAEIETRKEPHMLEFAQRLKELLQSSIQEQDKESVMLKVIKAQLE